MSILRDAINAADPAPDRKKELTLALNLISELAEQKVTEFGMAIRDSLRTAGNPENRTIPVTEILASHSEYRAYVKADVSKIATEVSAAIKKFVSGGSDEIIDGVADLVTTGLEAILGSGQAIQQEMHSYYIIVQDYAIVRYDISAWARSIEANGITSHIEHAMAIQAFKSSVDVMKISFNTFLIAYGQQLSQMGFDKQAVLQYLDAAEEVYKRLRDLSGDSLTEGSPTAAAASIADRTDFKNPGELVFRQHQPGWALADAGTRDDDRPRGRRGRVEPRRRYERD